MGCGASARMESGSGSAYFINETGASTKDVKDVYKLGRQLGQPGQYGRALLATTKDGKRYAVKEISKAKFARFSNEQRKKVFLEMRGEIEILKIVKHPNCLKLYDVYENRDYLYLATEFCGGGELFDRITELADAGKNYSEKDAADVISQVLRALQYLHEEMEPPIAHCDLKPDNFLFSEKDGNVLKVIDFGMSKRLPKRAVLKRLSGTPYYTAPEVIRRKYGVACDIWSVGVVMFVMLFGFPPFYVDPSRLSPQEEAAQIYRKIQKGFQPVTKKGWGAFFPSTIKVSDQAKDLISKLLIKDIKKRWTATQALDHEWFKKAPAENLGHLTLNGIDMPGMQIKSFKQFHKTNKFNVACLHVFSSVIAKIDPTQKDLLEKTFDAIDSDHDGKISLEEFITAMTNTKGFNEGEAREMFENLDVDGDHKLNKDELMISITQKMMCDRQERLYQAFTKLDANGDGYIDPSEMKKALAATEHAEDFAYLGDPVALIEAADLDNDGKINLSEFYESLDPPAHKDEHLLEKAMHPTQQG